MLPDEHTVVAASTPLMRQYLAIKRQHPDSIVLFRLGDFFETFGDDAVVTARVCGIALTKRNNGAAGDVPLAGFPHHQLDTYLPKLIAAGHRVAVCEQLEDPKHARGIVKRGVVEIVTPGVALYDKVLDAGQNRYVMALYRTEHTTGFAYADVSTGEFVTGEVLPSEILPLLEGLQPTELLIPKPEANEWRQMAHQLSIIPALSPLEPWHFEPQHGYRHLVEHFRTTSLKGFGIEHLREGIGAAGALLRYIGDAQLGKTAHLRSLRLWHSEQFMLLDSATRRNLDLLPRSDSRFWLGGVLDRTITPMGTRMLRLWLSTPMRELEAINERLDAVEHLVTYPTVRSKLRSLLEPIGDIERLTTKVSTGRATPRDVRVLATALAQVPLLVPSVDSLPPSYVLSQLAGHLQLLYQHIDTALVDEPAVQLGSGGVFRPGFNAELDAALEALVHGKEWLNRYQEHLRSQTGIASLKLGYNNVFGYYIEVTNAHRTKVPDWFERKQTLTSAERYTTAELRELETRITHAAEQVSVLEQQLFAQLRAEIAESATELQQAAYAIATLDVFQSLAEVASHNGYVRPRIRTDNLLHIEAGRHPVVEAILPLGQHYQPNSTWLDPNGQFLHIITGPNMAGKSCYLRQVGLIVLLAHIGSFVPADRAEIPLTDRIFTRVGAQDNLGVGESTFLVEMQETATIVNNATSRSLLLLDEIGRGTATREGIAIAWAVLEYILNHIKAKTLCATHYRELTELADYSSHVGLYQAEVKEVGSTLLFPHRIIPGVSDHSFGIHVAQMAGIPKPILERAGQVLTSLQQQNLDATDPVTIANTRMVQLSIFEASDDPIREQLRHIDVDRITPLQALQLLAELIAHVRKRN